MVFFRRKPDVPAAAPAAPTRAEIAAAVARPEALPEVPALPPHPVPAEVPQAAPMFVKLDKYREIISELGELKNFIAAVKQIFSILSDLEVTREDAMKSLRASVQRMEKAVAAIDSELLRPIGFEAFPHGEVEVKHIESSLTALQQQLAGLRRELEGFRT